MQKNKIPWFWGAVVYQIYPRSFKDSNGDGIGDLPGILEKLDYLAGKPDSLGVTAIWLSPFYTSPMADFGYDISDFCGVDPIFGTLDDFKKLVFEAHKRNLKVIIDFVPNHTSDQHPWFVESKKSKDNPKHDWYIWKDPGPDGRLPNNWLSVFGGSAWQFDETRRQYFMHSFLNEQPDLNWDNPEVRNAIKDIIKFWFDLGIDGFRVDSVMHIAKDSEFRDDPPNPNPDNGAYAMLLHKYSKGGPKVYKYLNEMAEVVKSYGDTFMITEAYFDVRGNINDYTDFYLNLDPSVSAPFNFDGIVLDWDAAQFQTSIDAFQGVLADEHLPIYSLGNHDKSRLASRVGKEAAKVAAVMLLTLPGMQFMYYGDEIGMTDSPISPEDVVDSWEKNEPGIGMGRDPERTPMQWDSSPNAGFSNAKPWLPVGPNFKQLNVDAENSDPHSYLSLYKELLALRKKSTALKYGDYNPLALGKGIFAYTRSYDAEKILVLLNFTNKILQLSQNQSIKQILVSNSANLDGPIITELQPNQAIVAEI